MGFAGSLVQCRAVRSTWRGRSARPVVVPTAVTCGATPCLIVHVEHIAHSQLPPLSPVRQHPKTRLDQASRRDCPATVPTGLPAGRRNKPAVCLVATIRSSARRAAMAHQRNGDSRGEKTTVVLARRCNLIGSSRYLADGCMVPMSRTSENRVAIRFHEIPGGQQSVVASISVENCLDFVGESTRPESGHRPFRRRMAAARGPIRPTRGVEADRHGLAGDRLAVRALRRRRRRPLRAARRSLTVIKCHSPLLPSAEFASGKSVATLRTVKCGFEADRFPGTARAYRLVAQPSAFSSAEKDLPICVSYAAPKRTREPLVLAKSLDRQPRALPSKVPAAAKLGGLTSSERKDKGTPLDAAAVIVSTVSVCGAACTISRDTASPAFRSNARRPTAWPLSRISISSCAGPASRLRTRSDTRIRFYRAASPRASPRRSRGSGS